MRHGSARTLNTRRCGSKRPPFAKDIFTDAKEWYVYVGQHALERAACIQEWSYEDRTVVAMALPLKRSPFEFSWPVQGRTVCVLSEGECCNEVYLLGHALIVCGASKAYGVVNNELTVWIRPIEREWAA